MKRIVLLDVSAIMYRAFFGNMNFRTKNEPTGAIYGFTNTLLSIIKEFSPDYIGAAQDVRRSELKRSEAFKGYKSNRQAMPEDLAAQIDRIEELLDSFGIRKFKISGYEADDVLGTLSKKFSNDEYEIFIITGDKDLAQLLDKNINIALLGKGENGGFKILSTKEDVKEHLGVYPETIPDLFGLIGDKSDGIPGVQKVGIKKAVPMLEKYNNLEGIYENVDRLRELPGIGPGLVNNIKNEKDMAFLSRDLARIETNIPIDIGVDDLKYSIDNNRLLTLFKTLEFKNFIKRMNLTDDGSTDAIMAENKKNNEDAKKEKAKEEKQAKTLNIGNNESSQLGLFGNMGNPVSSGNESKKEDDFKEDETIIEGREVVIVDTEEKLDKLCEELSKDETIYFYSNDMGVAVARKDKDYYLPINHMMKLGSEYTNIDKKHLDKIFSMDKKFVTYKFKDVLRNYYKIARENMYFDEMLAYHLITSQTKEDIDGMIISEGEELQIYSELFGKEKPEETDILAYGKYLCVRGSKVRKLYPTLRKELVEKDLLEVLTTIEMPLIEVLNAMEEEGIMIDPEYFHKFSIEVDGKLKVLEDSIYKIAGGEFNLNSPKQLSEVLFFKLNIQPVKKTKTGYSTNVDVLEELERRGEEIAKYILEYRKLAKLKSTYIDALPKSIDENNKIHTSFNQTGTATGRLSSSDPNLQNIPVKTDDGIRIREGFVAKKGYKLLGIDYSQIELRVLAEISEDENLIKAYGDDKDLHSLTARRIFDLPEEDEVTREQRTAAKIVNFSIIYGKTPFGLSKELQITRKEAVDYIDKYFAQYPKVQELEHRIIEFAEQNGYVETYFKRRREIDGINSKNKNIRNQADRMAVNTVIQGTAAEVLKKVMVALYDVLRDKEDIKMILQVHDELIFEVKEDKVLEYKAMIEDMMQNTVKFKNVKLKVNSAIGDNWAETK